MPTDPTFEKEETWPHQSMDHPALERRIMPPPPPPRSFCFLFFFASNNTKFAFFCRVSWFYSGMSWAHNIFVFIQRYDSRARVSSYSCERMLWLCGITVRNFHRVWRLWQVA